MPRPCDRVAELVPALLDGGRPESPKLLHHVEGCLRCQAELARYRRVERLLAQLRHEREELPPGLVADVLASVERVAQRRAVRSALAGRRAALAGGMAALAALAGVAVVSRGREDVPLIVELGGDLQGDHTLKQ